MNFLKKIKSNIYDPEFYSGIINNENGGHFRYFFKLIFLVAVFYTMVISVTAVPGVRDFFSILETKVTESFPRELEVKVEKGIATSNVIEPYFIKFPDEAYKDSDTTDGFENLLVLDTKGDFSLEKFDSYKTMALLTKDGLVTRDGVEKTTITSLKSFPDFTVNYNVVTKWLGKIKPYLNTLSFLVPVLILSGVFVAYLFTLVYLLFAALIVFAIGKIKKLGLSYKKSYQISLHAVTLPLIYEALAFLLGIPSVAFLPTLVFVIVVALNLKNFVSEAEIS